MAHSWPVVLAADMWSLGAWWLATQVFEQEKEREQTERKKRRYGPAPLQPLKGLIKGGPYTLALSCPSSFLHIC